MGRKGKGARRGSRTRGGRKGGSNARAVSANGTDGVSRNMGTDRVMGASTEEFVVTAGSGAFTVINLFMSPGIAGSVNQFPRLRILGSLYSEYRWVRCSVKYKPVVGTAAVGRVALAASYDPDSDTTPTVFRELLATTPHVSGPTYRNLTLNVPCSKNGFQKNWYPVAPDATIPDADSTVPFVVYVGTDQGVSGTVGYLEIDWVIDFKNPIEPGINPN